MAGETIRLINIWLTYASSGTAGEPVLRGIDLDVQAGEFLAIHGRSGSGKTTLLHMIGGILPPTKGEVVVGSHSLFSLNDLDLSAFRNRKIGFIFQSYHLAPTLTAVENAMVPALLAGQSLAQARKRAMETLNEVGLSDKADARPAEMSGGQMQRVAIARALVNDPAILLADEPTGNLDAQTGVEILALLGRYHLERRLTVLMATHDSSVEMHATHQLYLTGGQLQPLRSGDDQAFAERSHEANP